MEREKSEFFLKKYLFLLVVIGILVFIKVYFSLPLVNISVSILAGVFYFLFGITTHNPRKNLNLLIVIEFLIISFLISLIIYNIT